MMLISQSRTPSCLHWSSSWTFLITKGENFSTEMWSEAMLSQAEFPQFEILGSLLIFSALLGDWRGMLKIWRSRYFKHDLDFAPQLNTHPYTVWWYEVSYFPLIESHFCSLSQGLCPIRDVPSTGNHDDPLSYFQIGDLIRGTFRGVVKHSDRNSIHYTGFMSQFTLIINNKTQQCRC